MRKWIFPCNPNKYDVDAAFNKLNELEWSQGRFRVEVGDLIYIYVGKPIKSIKYLCEVTETDIPVENCKLNDGEFSLIGRPNITDALLYMKIRLIKKYEEGIISLEKMEKHGVNGRIQSARTVPKELENYINNQVDSNTSNTATYIVFQGYSSSECEDGFLWAPFVDEKGKAYHHWSRLADLKPGDKVFHYYKGYIKAISKITSTYVEAPHPYRAGDNEILEHNGRLVLCDPYILEEPIDISKFTKTIIKYKSDNYSAFNKNGKANYGYLFRLEPEIAMLFNKAVTEKYDPLPEELVPFEEKQIVEGAKKIITVNSYERDPKAKKRCKDFYLKRDGRITCQICGFDFGDVYGTEYLNMIHMHHIVPMSEIGEEYIVNPEKDLIPVCPNCHMVLHAGEGISVEELKNRLKSRKRNNKDD